VTGPPPSCAKAGGASNAKANVTQASFIVGFASGIRTAKPQKGLAHSRRAQSRNRQFYSPLRHHRVKSRLWDRGSATTTGVRRAIQHSHVWTALADQGFSVVTRSSRVRSFLRPFGAGRCPLALMVSAGSFAWSRQRAWRSDYAPGFPNQFSRVCITTWSPSIRDRLIDLTTPGYQGTAVP
jgi:hypothetical protein